jgi:hypothetical protein
MFFLFFLGWCFLILYPFLEFFLVIFCGLRSIELVSGSWPKSRFQRLMQFAFYWIDANNSFLSISLECDNFLSYLSNQRLKNEKTKLDQNWFFLKFWKLDGDLIFIIQKVWGWNWIFHQEVQKCHPSPPYFSLWSSISQFFPLLTILAKLAFN